MNTSESLQTTVLATVEPQSLNSVLSELHNLQGISFYTPATGRFDLVIWLNTTEQTKVYSLVNEIRAIEGVVSTRTLIPFNGFANGRNFKQSNSLATVLLGVSGQAQNVVKALQQLPSVYSAYVTPGEFDIVATVYGSDYSQIATQVMKIAQTKGISTSETLFAIKPFWA
jgi:DNA-binding Lrp family transcriptional regulator